MATTAAELRPTGDRDAPSPSASSQPADQAAMRAASRILVVEDDNGIRMALVALLEDEGYVVEEAANGREALASLEREPPAVVLLDMRMPVMDGWELAQVLRARQIDVRLVVMTAARDARTWAEEIGARAYIGKPFDPDALLAILDRLCSE
jgi:CheY-like chemotaxis protein